MECTFSPALVAKNASFLDGGNSKSKGNKPLTDNNAAVALAFASLPFADDESLAQAGAGGGGASANGRSRPVHERLYSPRGRGKVCAISARAVPNKYDSGGLFVLTSRAIKYIHCVYV